MDVCCFAAFIAPPPSWLMGAFLQMSSLEVFKGQKIPVIDTPAAFDNNLFVPSICYHTQDPSGATRIPWNYFDGNTVALQLLDHLCGLFGTLFIIDKLQPRRQLLDKQNRLVA